MMSRLFDCGLRYILTWTHFRRTERLGGSGVTRVVYQTSFQQTIIPKVTVIPIPDLVKYSIGEHEEGGDIGRKTPVGRNH